MFDDNTQAQNTTTPVMPSAPTVSDPTTSPVVTPAVTAADPAAANPGFSVPSLPADPLADPLANQVADQAADQVATPVTSDASVPAFSTTDTAASETASSADTTAVSSDLTPVADVTAPTAPSSSNNTDGSDLLSIKQDALQSLSPLLGQLEQTPEEKFRTTMMLIQASDDQSLIQAAYAAAKEISDEKVRAQALLDIVNEINYFTQQAKSAS